MLPKVMVVGVEKVGRKTAATKTVKRCDDLAIKNSPSKPVGVVSTTVADGVHSLSW